MKIPNRLSMEKSSPFYNAAGINLAVSVNGVEQTKVIEYCISGGWVRRYTTDEAGNIIPNVLGSGAKISRAFGVVKVWNK